LFLLLFIAGPLRRFGAYTIPDFAEGRFDSPLFRKIAVVFVLFIGFFYTMPQMKGAGTTLAYIFPGLPYWAGVVLVGAVITLNVALGGMKGITLVQAFQYWAKMFAISVPIFVLMAVYGHYGKHLEVNGGNGERSTSNVQRSTNATLNVQSSKLNVERSPLPEKAPADATWLNPFGPLTTKAAKAAKLSPEESKPYSLLYTYSLIIALVCGTAGLPHILVRFYTNPDGVAAKRTTMWVMILIGVFYVFPPVFGVMGRNLLPSLYEGVGAKGTDKVVLELPRILNAEKVGKWESEKVGEGTNTGAHSPAHSPTFPPAASLQPKRTKIPWGSILSGITCAGAFAAFMSTFSGLLVSMTGAMAHDVYGRMLNPKATPKQRLRAFKIAAVGIGAVAILLGMQVEPLQINFMVGQAFAIAAASYFPLLFVSVWWRNLTMKGAATGMLTGGTLALAGISLTSFSDLKWLPLDAFWAAHPLLRILCEQPAIWAVPLAIALMVVVSKLTQRDVPADIRMKMLVLHAPEKLGLKQEYIQEHQTGH
jgi:Na+(H+)/acetate symporter ActP